LCYNLDIGVVINYCLNTCRESRREVFQKLVVELQDSQIVISQYKSGFLPPQDVAFEELTMTGSNVSLHRTGGSSGRRRPAIFGRFRSAKVAFCYSYCG